MNFKCMATGYAERVLFFVRLLSHFVYIQFFKEILFIRLTTW